MLQTVTGTPGTGAFTLSTAVAGYQALGAGDDGNSGRFYALEGTAWEEFEGTYTHSGTSLARTVRYDSSTGSAISFTSAAVVFQDFTASIARAVALATACIPPTGRLSLTTGVPITSGDVTGATTLYYTPYGGNVVSLWDGKLWIPTPFTEQSLALGTMTSGKGYDVFAFLNAGAVNIEKLVWTSAVARATAVTLQDGRLCKSGAKDRLWVGSFYAPTTTTTEDSALKRFVFNAYNRKARRLFVSDAAGSWLYQTNATRQANGNSANQVEVFIGMDEGENVSLSLKTTCLRSDDTGATGSVGIGMDTLVSPTSDVDFILQNQANNYVNSNVPYNVIPGLGYHYFAWLENGGGTTNQSTFVGAAVSSLSGQILA